MKDFWNTRYSAKEFAYGTAPNQFFQQSIDELELSGKILLPAEGEGRNAVYAAKSGWDVFAFDISSEGKNKALTLAKNEQTKIQYDVGDFMQMDFEENSFDACALIFAHFPPPLLAKYHDRISKLIKPNGILILEAFSKKHLQYNQKNPKVGGPKNIEMLFSEELIKKDFSNFEILQLQEVEIELNEGQFHIGTGSVIRFIGRKMGGR